MTQCHAMTLGSDLPLEHLDLSSQVKIWCWAFTELAEGAAQLWGSWFGRKDWMFQAHASRNLHKTLRFHVSEPNISNILIINVILCLMPRIILEKRIKAIIPLGYALAWVFYGLSTLSTSSIMSSTHHLAMYKIVLNIQLL